MKQISRRGFISAASAAAAVPALAAVTARAQPPAPGAQPPARGAQPPAPRAQPPAPDIGDLRAERDIVFGRGGDIGQATA